MNLHIALVGGNEFQNGCEDMDEEILKTIGVRRPKVVILPTAAAKENPLKSASNGISYFSRLGTEASAMMILSKKEAMNNDFMSPINKADLVYITGGNPEQLLNTLRGSYLLKKLIHILNRGAVLVGSSAGAMVFGSRMHFNKWTKALSILHDIAILPHHEHSNPSDITRKLRNVTPTLTTALGIDSMTCCFNNRNKWEVYGRGTVTVYSGNEWAQYKNGGTIPIPNPQSY